jgi:plasmid maintenance system antidote protein VapI
MHPMVWGSLVAEIKTCTLESRVSDLTPDFLETVRSISEGQQDGRWAPITSILDDRSVIRAELHDRLERFVEAEWLPDTKVEGATLAELARESGITASQLAQKVGTSPGDARRMLQGRREITAPQLAAITTIFGVAPQSSVTFDDNLIEELDLPHFRSMIDTWAHRHHVDDPVAARRRAAERVMAFAARHREPGQRNWRALIEEALGDD